MNSSVCRGCLLPTGVTRRFKPQTGQLPQFSISYFLYLPVTQVNATPSMLCGEVAVPPGQVSVILVVAIILNWWSPVPPNLKAANY